MREMPVTFAESRAIKERFKKDEIFETLRMHLAAETKGRLIGKTDSARQPFLPVPLPFCSLAEQIESARPEWEPRLNALIRRGIFVLGDEGRAFEREFAALLHARFAVGVANGTDAISLSLRAARVHGTVCTTALTAPFTAIAIKAAGLTPRFVDIDEDTLQMDPGSLESTLTADVGAIVAVHLYGQPCSIDTISGIAGKYGVTLVQDACQAHGATGESGQPFTAFSDYVAYSFYPTKNLGCLGDGGAVLSNSGRAEQRLRLLRNGGRREGHVSWVTGANSRLDEIQACFLRVFLQRLTNANAARNRLAAAYDDALSNCPGVKLVRRSRTSVCHLYVVRAESRGRLRQWLLKDGIQTAIHYSKPLHLHPAFSTSKQKRGSLPNAEQACESILSLPLWIGMTENDVWRVADRIQSFYS